MMQPNEILELRQRMGLTQKQFAEVIGVCLMTIHHWEKGHKRPYKIFAMKLEELRGGEESNHDKTGG